jgi:hypothetical protein
MNRLLSSAITCTYDNGGHYAVKHVTPVESASLWWNPKNPEQISLWKSSLTLNLTFFAEVTSSPVPLRMSTLAALRGSSMCLDVYSWLSYRNFYAKRPSRIPWEALILAKEGTPEYRPSRIPWEALQMQFGSGYPETTRGRLNFKRKFLLALKKVAVAYPEALKLQAETDVLVYVPGYPDVSPLIPNET